MSIDLLRRRFAMGVMPTDVIINRKWSDNDAALMDVIYAQEWSKSPNYMTKREAEAVTNIGEAFRGNTQITLFEQFKYFTSVTSIPAYAFENCSSLANIDIPLSITSIGAYAYKNCTSLDILILPCNVQVVGNFLNGCGAISSLTFVADSVNQYFRSNINYYIKANASGVTFANTYIEIQGVDVSTLVVPSSITSISTRLFTGVRNISEIILHENVTSIEGSAFNGSSLTKINIPNSIKTIGVTAFHGCTINNSINIPENCNLAGYAFSYTTIVGNLYIPKSVKYVNTSFLGVSGASSLKVDGTATILITEILQAQFQNCSFKELILNFDEIISIGYQPFAMNNSYYQGTSLKNPYFPNVETIGDYAFDYMSKITTLRFGNKVTSIGVTIARSAAVSGCYLEATIPPTISVRSGTISQERNWYVPRSAQAAYEVAAGWSDLNAAGKLKFIEEL